MVDGRRIDATDVDRRRHVFRLPAAAASARIVSRAGIPIEHAVARDARELGVALRRVVAHRPGRSEALEAEHLSGLSGFHPIERDRDGAFCWTNGDAALPDSLWAGADGVNRR